MQEKIAILGGTGELGRGLALRFAKAGFDVLIGSRQEPRAVDAAVELNQMHVHKPIVGHENLAAAQMADIVFIAVPYENHAQIVEQIHSSVQQKLVVDVVVPLQPPNVSHVHIPEGGSVAATAQRMLGEAVKVVGAFHTISARKLISDDVITSDVLVFGNDKEACDRVVELAAMIGVGAVAGGPIGNSVAAEAMTAVLIHINKAYKVKGGAGIKVDKP